MHFFLFMIYLCIHFFTIYPAPFTVLGMTENAEDKVNFVFRSDECQILLLFIYFDTSGRLFRWSSGLELFKHNRCIEEDIFHWFFFSKRKKHKFSYPCLNKGRHNFPIWLHNSVASETWLPWCTDGFFLCPWKMKTIAPLRLRQSKSPRTGALDSQTSYTLFPEQLIDIKGHIPK